MKTYPVVRFVVGGEEVPISDAGREYTMVYDGACRVCTRAARLVERWDRGGRIEVIASQAPGVHARFPWIPPDAYAESLQLVGPGGRTWQGAYAIDRLLGLLPFGRTLGWIFRLPLVGRIADRLYRWFARNRYRLGCGEHCQYRPLKLDYGEGDAEAGG